MVMIGITLVVITLVLGWSYVTQRRLSTNLQILYWNSTNPQIQEFVTEPYKILNQYRTDVSTIIARIRVKLQYIAFGILMTIAVAAMIVAWGEISQAIIGFYVMMVSFAITIGVSKTVSHKTFWIQRMALILDIVSIKAKLKEVQIVLDQVDSYSEQLRLGVESGTLTKIDELVAHSIFDQDVNSIRQKQVELTKRIEHDEARLRDIPTSR